MRFRPFARLCLLLALGSARSLPAALPPVPVPAENPITEPKRVLGKILFWDEQLSADDSVACGTCHRPAYGGADPRAGRYPGVDKGTIDDVRGSPGLVSLDSAGRRVPHPVFGAEPQVTARVAPSYFGALWADELFWDGRAGTVLNDPLTGATAIARGGALENAALTALANAVEMAEPGRTWDELGAKLARVEPLALATRLPMDVAAALAATATASAADAGAVSRPTARDGGSAADAGAVSRPRYPALFAAAFGDAAITPVRIAFALASYERTLVSDATAWDRYEAGDTSALGARALYGWRAFQDFHCNACHTPPLFTSNDFFQIGVRRAEFDRGRENVTHDPEDAGEMKVPSLRNAALKARFMHTGELATLGAAIAFYVTAPALPERDGIPGFGLYTFNMSRIDESDLREFLETGLVDPRVRDETFPFDRPQLRSERATATDGGSAAIAERILRPTAEP
ncbi:MAG TPA: cytochrome c peroxidase [Gammaproteobacteria bacterium]|nr:cytochrome c peroxidase [Gammaproteobacteria bacterium]